MCIEYLNLLAHSIVVTIFLDDFLIFSLQNTVLYLPCDWNDWKNNNIFFKLLWLEKRSVTKVPNELSLFLYQTFHMTAVFQQHRFTLFQNTNYQRFLGSPESSSRENKKALVKSHRQRLDFHVTGSLMSIYLTQLASLGIKIFSSFPSLWEILTKMGKENFEEFKKQRLNQKRWRNSLREKRIFIWWGFRVWCVILSGNMNLKFW